MLILNKNKYLKEINTHYFVRLYVLSAFFWTTLCARMHQHLTTGKWELQKMLVKSHFYAKRFFVATPD